MSYSNAVYSKAYNILDERRVKAINDAELRKRKIYAELPRAEEIERELASYGIMAAKAVFAGGDVKAQLSLMADKSSALRAELDSLLSEAGYSKSDLEPQFTCPVCSDRGTVEKENRTIVCQCFKDILKDCACREVNRFSPLSLSTFDNFDLSLYPDSENNEGVNPRRRMTQILAYCKSYANSFNENSKNVLMRGATGLGKTHLSLSIANELLERGYSVVYVSAPDILFQLEKAHFSYGYDSESDLISTLSECDLLIIDDLGTEFSTNFTVSQIYNIFNNRILRSKPVIINTNLTIKELENSYSQRFVSRIMGTCDKLDFVGRDIRPQKV